jgi:hypothetical protein
MDKIIINDYLAYSNISVPTTITYTILNQPEIITIMNKINKIDVSILERKITNFMGKNVSNDKSSIVLISFLCCLMYKNNIFPQYIYDILKKLNINDVSVEELRQNSENLINILLDNSKGGGKRGGANFNIIFGTLLNIGFVLVITILDYYYITNQTIPKIYEKATQIVQKTISISQNMENCEYIQIPPTIRYLDKYNKNGWNIELIYRTLTCVANSNMNQYLQDELFIPRNIQKSNLMITFSDIEKESKQIMEETVSRELVPPGYKFDENTESIKSLVNQEEFQKQMDVLNTQLQPVLSKIDYTIDNLNVYNEEGKLDLDKTKQKLIIYEKMPEEELLGLLYPKPEIISKKKKYTNEASIISDVYEFTKDTFSLLYHVSKTAAEETENISAIDITKQWIWVLKDYFVKKIRDIEDIQTKTKRDITDFITEANRTKENILDFLNVLKWLIPANIYMMAIIARWIYSLTNRIMNKNRNSNTLSIESGKLAIEDNYENPLKGGKSKNNKRKNKRRTRKLNSKTKKIKRRTRKSRK